VLTLLLLLLRRGGCRGRGVCVHGCLGEVGLGVYASAADAVLSDRGPSNTQTVRLTGTSTALRPHTEHTDATGRGQVRGDGLSLVRVGAEHASWAEKGVPSSTCLAPHGHTQALDKAAEGGVAWLLRL